MINNTIRWRKSSFSGAGANECIECAGQGSTHSVRDSKNPDGPVIRFGHTAWQDLLTLAKRC